MKVGTVCYATTQGLGHLAKWFREAGIIQEALMFRHPRGDRETHAEWWPPGTPVVSGRPFQTHHAHEVDRFLRRIDVCLFFETPFDWHFADECRRRGVKTALMPMYEWFPEHPPHRFDLYLCPSLLDLECFPPPEFNSLFLPVPADPRTWRLRERANLFLHNAGHVGARNHKGTEELLRALEFVTRPMEVKVTCQSERLMQALLESTQATVRKSSAVTLRWETGDRPYWSLFAEGDAYVAPEKFNGLSLPLQEARAAGLLVITTDRFPANTWLPKEPLIPVAETRRARTMAGHLEFEESVVDPRDLAKVLDRWAGVDVEVFSLSGKRWAEEHSWEQLKPAYEAALRSVL